LVYLINQHKKTTISIPRIGENRMKIHLRYCSAWNYEPKAVSLTAKILMQFKQQVSSLELQPDQGGCFELTVGNELIYSKLETKEFPDEDQVITAIAEQIAW